MNCPKCDVPMTAAYHDEVVTGWACSDCPHVEISTQDEEVMGVVRETMHATELGIQIVTAFITGSPDLAVGLVEDVKDAEDLKMLVLALAGFPSWILMAICHNQPEDVVHRWRGMVTSMAEAGLWGVADEQAAPPEAGEQGTE